MSKMEYEALEFLHGLPSTLIPWPTILAWLTQYGWPIVQQVLAVLLTLLPLILAKRISVADALKWAEEALIALASGQPMPPTPVPTP